jgi:hypothetical protein
LYSQYLLLLHKHFLVVDPTPSFFTIDVVTTITTIITIIIIIIITFFFFFFFLV